MDGTKIAVLLFGFGTLFVVLSGMQREYDARRAVLQQQRHRLLQLRTQGSTGGISVLQNPGRYGSMENNNLHVNAAAPPSRIVHTRFGRTYEILENVKLSRMPWKIKATLYINSEYQIIKALQNGYKASFVQWKRSTGDAWFFSLDENPMDGEGVYMITDMDFVCFRLKNY